MLSPADHKCSLRLEQGVHVKRLRTCEWLFLVCRIFCGGCVVFGCAVLGCTVLGCVTVIELSGSFLIAIPSMVVGSSSCVMGHLALNAATTTSSLFSVSLLSVKKYSRLSVAVPHRMRETEPMRRM